MLLVLLVVISFNGSHVYVHMTAITPHPTTTTIDYIYIAYARNAASGPKSTDPTNTYRISRFTHNENGINSFAQMSSEVVLWTDNMGYPQAEDQYNYPVWQEGGGYLFYSYRNTHTYSHTISL